jgi:protein translocase SecG subunit
MDYLLMILFLIVCLLLIVVVLLQKGRGGGLGGAFGGAGGSGAFGTRTGDVFTWVTIVLTGAFLVLAVIGTVVARPDLGQVLAPVLDPSAWPEGQEGNHVTVTMTCDTKGSTIRYTIDGREPTEKSLAYGTSSVIVKRGQTLRVKAFRVGMDPSPTVEVKYAPQAPETAPAPIPAIAPATQPAK